MPHEFLVDTQLSGLKSTKIDPIKRLIPRPPPKLGPPHTLQAALGPAYQPRVAL